MGDGPGFPYSRYLLRRLPKPPQLDWTATLFKGQYVSGKIPGSSLS